MKALAARRRHPAAIALLILVGLLVTGGAYSFAAPKDANASAAAADTVAQGKTLFLANCASCHGTGAQGTNEGPSLYGVGAAAVDFQMSTGRMPMTSPNVQAPAQQDIKFTSDQIAAIAAFVASLAPGPAVPDQQYTTVIEPGTQENNEAIARGGEIFRVNCAMCHNFAGAGGALTRGKYAPPLQGIDPVHIYEAMVTGPQSMPVFSDTNIKPASKQQLISYLHAIENRPEQGGMTLGNLGPVSEGLFAWTFGIGILIGCAIWLGKKAA
ncbi:MAG: c-type cytochrome [Intrasporangium sp.]|uniref:cytochrome bc1 complex diheme cytochrome c subunit n=1 Tax=Intrasporangium sp. TaxID=1925024 RepID=UPI00264985F6|nr:c-type cytochrome [Intrasporangium sp.]MDN5795064.1 c-type cytochrome [Intrasporangium sp.]